MASIISKNTKPNNMNIEEEIFKRSQIDIDKLASYGFIKKENIFEYAEDIMENTFRVIVTVDRKKQITGKIIDLSTEEEYNNYRLTTKGGEFSCQIRAEFEKVLSNIEKKCTIRKPFITDQANKITALIKEKYGDNPEFTWEKYPGFGTFKNALGKWYALIINIPKNKLSPKESDEEVEIINIKIVPEKIDEMLKLPGFYPAYHMNKKNWISIILDGTINDKEILDYIETSYKLVK